MPQPHVRSDPADRPLGADARSDGGSTDLSDPSVRQRLLKDPFVASAWRGYRDKAAAQGIDAATLSDAEADAFWVGVLPRVLEALHARIPEAVADARGASRAAQARFADEQRRVTAQIGEWWGEALDLLAELACHAELVLVSVLERLGEEPGPKVLALIGLWGRGIRVAREVVALLRAGYARAGEAHWRTLDELQTVATLLARHDDALAQRYLDHAVVSRLQVEKARAAVAPAGVNPELEAAEARVCDMIAQHKYGEAFRTPYGWAETVLPRANKSRKNQKRPQGPTFEDIRRAAGRPGLRASYVEASEAVHGGVGGMITDFNLAPDHPPTRPSPIGIDQPGVLTAGSLGLLVSPALTSDVANGPWCALQMQIVFALAAAVADAFTAAGQRHPSRQQAG